MDKVVAEKGTWENLARDNVTMAMTSDGLIAVYVDTYS